MIGFIPKKITTETSIGEKLQTARRTRNWDIESIAKKLKIRTEYLIAMEENRFDSLPAGLYGKNFLKQYAVYLGMKPKEIFKDIDLSLFGENETDPFSQKILKSSKLLVWPKIIRNLLTFGAVFACFLYLIFYFKNIVTAPNLEISSPDKNILITKTSITIIGRSEPEAEIKINGEVVLNNDRGDFSQEVNLKKGLNSLTVTAKKKYSRENTVIRQILVE